MRTIRILLLGAIVVFAACGPKSTPSRAERDEGNRRLRYIQNTMMNLYPALESAAKVSNYKLTALGGNSGSGGGAGWRSLQVTGHQELWGDIPTIDQRRALLNAAVEYVKTRQIFHDHVSNDTVTNTIIAVTDLTACITTPDGYASFRLRELKPQETTGSTSRGCAIDYNILVVVPLESEITASPTTGP